MEPIVKHRKLTEYRPDPHNANAGSERGQYMLDRSVQEVGATRSLVASADDTIPIGNHAMQALADAGIVDVIEVETDGRQVVVVKRRDWETADDPTARRAAYFDNRTSEVSLRWNVEQILADTSAGVDLSDMFFENEIAALVNGALNEAAQYDLLDAVPDVGQAVGEAVGEAPGDPARRQHAAHFPLAIVLNVTDMRRWAAVKRDVLGYQDDTRAFLALLDMAEGA